jgi:antitoxin ParD1/3/4
MVTASRSPGAPPSGCAEQRANDHERDPGCIWGLSKLSPIYPLRLRPSLRRKRVVGAGTQSTGRFRSRGLSWYARHMTITLNPEQEAWLETRVASGDFASVEAAARQLIDERIAERALEEGDDLAWAKPYIDEALAEIARGEEITLEEHKLAMRQGLLRFGLSGEGRCYAVRRRGHGGDHCRSRSQGRACRRRPLQCLF